jgi:hypothetical protein
MKTTAQVRGAKPRAWPMRAAWSGSAAGRSGLDRPRRYRAAVLGGTGRGENGPGQRYARGAVMNLRVSADRGSARMSRTVLANASWANGFGETACRCAEFRAAACFVGVARVVQHLQLRIVSPRRAGDGVGRAAANEHSSPENAIIAGCAATCFERTASNGGSVQEIQENRRGSIDHVSDTWVVRRLVADGPDLTATPLSRTPACSRC